MARRPSRAVRDAARRRIVDVYDVIADLATALLDDTELTDAAEQIGAQIKQASYDEAARDLGTDLTMGNVGKNGLRVGVAYTVTGPGKVYLHYRPTSLWAWLEEGTRRHDIPRRRKTSRGRDPKTVFLRAPGYDRPVRGPIKHPGWKNPPRTFTRAMGEAQDIPFWVMAERVQLIGTDQGWS